MKRFTRRDFVQTAIGASAGGMLLSLPGCGKSGETTGTKPNPPGTLISTDERTAALRGVSSFFDTLPHTSVADDNQRLLTFLQSNARFKAAGSVAAGSIWARFQDDTSLSIVNNGSIAQADVARLRGKVSASALAGVHEVPHASLLSIPPDQLPTAKKIYLSNNLGIYSGADGVQNNGTNALLSLMQYQRYVGLQRSLGRVGYDVTLLDGSPAGMANVRDVDVFCMYGHLGRIILPDGTPTLGLGTSLPVLTFNLTLDAANYLQSLPDVQNGLIAFMMYTDFDSTTGAPIKPWLKSYYFITPKFIATRMTLSSRSFAFVNGCASSGAAGAVLVPAFGLAKAGSYAGWDGLVNGEEVIDSGQFLLETMAGVHEFYSPSPPVRAFAYNDARKLLKAVNRPGTSYGYDESVGDGTGSRSLLQISLLNESTPEMGILAPSIFGVGASGDTLTIGGTFGDVPGTVTIGGRSAAIKTWTSGGIACELPSVDQPGSAGDVVVTSAGNVASNPVRLTMWDLTFTYDATYDSASFSTAFDTCVGSYRVHAVFNVKLRGDIHFARASPEETPPSALSLPQFENTSFPNKNAKLTSYTIAGTITHTVHTGNLSNPDDKTVIERTTPNGSAPYVYDDTNSSIPHQQSVLSIINKGIHVSPGTLTLEIRIVLPSFTTTLMPNDIIGVAGFGAIVGSRPMGPGGDGTIQMTFNSDGNIAAGQAPASNNSTLSWAAASPVAGTAPDFTAAC